MSSKILFNILCLSLALIQIQAFVRQPEQRNGFPQPSVEQELSQHSEDSEKHHYHRHHHHKHHHKMAEKPTPHMIGHKGLPPPPHHQMMAQLWPLFRAMLSKKYSKSGGLSASDDSKLDTESKATAHIKSKFQTKITETDIINSGPNSKLESSKVILMTKFDFDPKDSRTYVKITDQKAESDAVVAFNANMDVISEKSLKAKSEEESQPIRGQVLKIGKVINKYLNTWFL